LQLLTIPGKLTPGMASAESVRAVTLALLDQ
jgi:hypothetical protein